MATNAPPAWGLASCTARANTSLPEPVSPHSSTGVWRAITRRAVSRCADKRLSLKVGWVVPPRTAARRAGRATCWLCATELLAALLSTPPNDAPADEDVRTGAVSLA